MSVKLGTRIKALRKGKNLSQEAFARILGVSFQAVSKWETNVTMPDVNLIPSIASYFGVSIDELFDYHAWENDRLIDEICRRACACRMNDPMAAETILRDGLRQFPANETLLTVLVYTLWAIPDRDDDLIAICKMLIDCATNEGVKCDVLRILAMVYHRAGKKELISPVLEQIPEFYFTKMECIAKLTDGEKSVNAARFQMNISGKSTVEMLRIMEENYSSVGDAENADRCNRISQGILEVFHKEGGHLLEVPGYEWLEDQAAISREQNSLKT